jgi:hypothetical protein
MIQPPATSESLKVIATRQSKLLIEVDRSESAVEAGYTSVITPLYPPEASS